MLHAERVRVAQGRRSGMRDREKGGGPARSDSLFGELSLKPFRGVQKSGPYLLEFSRVSQPQNILGPLRTVPRNISVGLRQEAPFRTAWRLVAHCTPRLALSLPLLPVGFSGVQTPTLGAAVGCDLGLSPIPLLYS